MDKCVIQKEEKRQATLKKDRIRWNIGKKAIQQYLQVYNDPDEDLGYVKLVETCVVIPLKLPQGIKFNITSTMI